MELRGQKFVTVKRIPPEGSNRKKTAAQRLKELKGRRPKMGR